MGVLDPASERAKQADLDEILGFLAALEKVINIPYTFTGATCWETDGKVRCGQGQDGLDHDGPLRCAVFGSLLPISLQQMIPSLPKKGEDCTSGKSFSVRVDLLPRSGRPQMGGWGK